MYQQRAVRRESHAKRRRSTNTNCLSQSYGPPCYVSLRHCRPAARTYTHIQLPGKTPRTQTHGGVADTCSLPSPEIQRTTCLCWAVLDHVASHTTLKAGLECCILAGTVASQVATLATVVAGPVGEAPHVGSAGRRVTVRALACEVSKLATREAGRCLSTTCTSARAVAGKVAWASANIANVGARALGAITSKVAGFSTLIADSSITWKRKSK